jgi:hypothetical protein
LDEENKNCSIKEPGPLQRGGDYKSAKMGEVVLNLLENHLAIKAQIKMKAS